MFWCSRRCFDRINSPIDCFCADDYHFSSYDSVFRKPLKLCSCNSGQSLHNADTKVVLRADDKTPLVAPTPSTSVLERENAHSDWLWLTIVWDDPINLMGYVTYVFQTVFGYSRTKATDLMLKVHNEGKAIVSSGTREKVEIDVKKLHNFGLWATMEQNGK